MSKSLSSRPDLEQLRTQAKDLLIHYRAGNADALARVNKFQPGSGALPRKSPLASPAPPTEHAERTGRSKAGAEGFRLHDAQLVIAREYGFNSWTRLKEHVESVLLETTEPRELFKKAFHDQDAAMFRRLLQRYPEF